jgi:7,8-dihydroneopterin aldolase/epimerase/oxygenase
MGTILLEGMEFFSYHGCFKEEQVIGTKFVIDLSVDLDTALAEKSDNLNETVNYVSLFRVLKTEMDQKAYLLEHVSWRIMESLQARFPQLTSINLKICKINPPIGGKMHQVCFATTWKK